MCFMEIALVPVWCTRAALLLKWFFQNDPIISKIVKCKFLSDSSIHNRKHQNKRRTDQKGICIRIYDADRSVKKSFCMIIESGDKINHTNYFACVISKQSGNKKERFRQNGGVQYIKQKWTFNRKRNISSAKNVRDPLWALFKLL